jgi:hypothetical protein
LAPDFVELDLMGAGDLWLKNLSRCGSGSCSDIIPMFLTIGAHIAFDSWSFKNLVTAKRVHLFATKAPLSWAHDREKIPNVEGAVKYFIGHLCIRNGWVCKEPGRRSGVAVGHRLKSSNHIVFIQSLVNRDISRGMTRLRCVRLGDRWKFFFRFSYRGLYSLCSAIYGYWFPTDPFRQSPFGLHARRACASCVCLWKGKSKIPVCYLI